MKYLTLTVIGLISITSSLARPQYDNQLTDEMYGEPPFQVEYIRERRSPQQPPQPPPQPPAQSTRNSVGVTGSYGSGQGGFVRGDYNREIWRGSNGARLDGNAYYQRNFHMPGPRQDYGAGIRFSAPF